MVNVFNTIKTVRMAKKMGAKNYFCVSTDKAANPVNMMGASKRIMEMFLMRKSLEISISTARFANVAFSDGSLLHGFNKRIEKRQPIAAPHDVKRYFVTQQESGELCLMSCIFGENRDIFFPKLSKELHLISFTDIAIKFLSDKGFKPFLCKTEDEARELITTLPLKGMWPCLFTSSTTTGEKEFEEFFTDKEVIDEDSFESLGVIKNNPEFDNNKLDQFENTIKSLKLNLSWTKEQIISQFKILIPGFKYEDKGKYLDGKM
jgi:FlaA1/EpsC-like NDP-sugar epimerase